MFAILICIVYNIIEKIKPLIDVASCYNMVV